MGQGALDDRRPHDGKGHPARRGQFLGGSFPQGLGERVHVGPPHGLGPGPAVLDQPLLHPLPPVLLGGRGHRDRPGSPMLRPGLVHESVEHLGLARRVFDVRSGRHGRARLGSPIDAVLEGGFGHHALGHPCHVGGGDVQQVRAAARGRNGLVQPGRSQHVDLEGMVDRRVEGHGGRAVEDGIEVAGEGRKVLGHVALHHRDPLGHDGSDRLVPQALSQRAEAVAGQQFLDPSRRGAPVPAAYQNRDQGCGEFRQQSFEQRSSEESGHTRQEDVPAGEGGTYVDGRWI